jgi:hypothetical protein
MQSQAPQKMPTLRLDDILACTIGPSQKLLGESVDAIRGADASLVTKKSDGITIHWQPSGDRRPVHNISADAAHAFESSNEAGFCQTGSLKLMSFPFPKRYLNVDTGTLTEGTRSPDSPTRTIELDESNLFIYEIVRMGTGYSLSPQQVYSGNHPFSQEKGVFKNSDEQFLLITMEPIQCEVKLTPDNGTHDMRIPVTKSKIGISLQWKQNATKPTEWVFYRVIYDSAGCPSD